MVKAASAWRARLPRPRDVTTSVRVTLATTRGTSWRQRRSVQEGVPRHTVACPRTRTHSHQGSPTYSGALCSAGKVRCRPAAGTHASFSASTGSHASLDVDITKAAFSCKIIALPSRSTGA